MQPHQRGRRDQYGSRWRTLRARVIAAHDVCARCQHPVDKSLPHLHPGAPQVGHIIPWSKGGTNDWDNVQLEHRLCNMRAGDRAQGDQPSTLSEPLPTSQDW